MFLNVSGNDTTMRSLFDVLLIYLESPNTPPTVSIELKKAPNLLACPVEHTSDNQSDNRCFLAVSISRRLLLRDLQEIAKMVMSK